MADYFSVLQHLERDTVPFVVYLYGEERYLIAEAKKRLKAGLLAGAKDFNFDDVDLKERGLERALAAARMLPMMAPRRLVIASRIDELKGGDDHDKLIAYVENPSPSTVLILVAATLDSRTRLAKALEQRRFTFKCEALKRGPLESYVRKAAAAQKLELAPDAFDALHEAYGSDLGQWMLALERFALYLGGAGVVDDAVVSALVVRTRTESIFALTDAVLSGRADVALPLAEELVRAQEAPLAMVGLCARQLRQLIILREAIDQGTPPREVLKQAQIPPFVADKYLDRARQVTLPALIRAHARLTEADRRLKSSPLPPGVTWFAALWIVLAESQPRTPYCS